MEREDFIKLLPFFLIFFKLYFCCCWMPKKTTQDASAMTTCSNAFLCCFIVLNIKRRWRRRRSRKLGRMRVDENIISDSLTSPLTFFFADGYKIAFNGECSLSYKTWWFFPSPLSRFYFLKKKKNQPDCHASTKEQQWKEIIYSCPNILIYAIINELWVTAGDWKSKNGCFLLMCRFTLLIRDGLMCMCRSNLCLQISCLMRFFWEYYFWK